VIPPPNKGRIQQVHDIKKGDLVRMKYISFWRNRGNPHSMPYTDVPMLVLETAYNAIKVITPDGRIKSELAENYDVLSR